MRLVHRRRNHFMREIVAEACRLVNACDDVRSVRIVGPGRPFYAEMRYYRQAAHDGHVRVAVDGAGVIALRPTVDLEPSVATKWSVHDTRRIGRRVFILVQGEVRSLKYKIGTSADCAFPQGTIGSELASGRKN